jgi:hypothetical protein
VPTIFFSSLAREALEPLISGKRQVSAKRNTDPLRTPN